MDKKDIENKLLEYITLRIRFFDKQIHQSNCLIISGAANKYTIRFRNRMQHKKISFERLADILESKNIISGR
jgi:hypothetical protein